MYAHLIARLNAHLHVHMYVHMYAHKQCYFSSRNHFYSSVYSVHDEINLDLVQFLFFWQQSF